MTIEDKYDIAIELGYTYSIANDCVYTPQGKQVTNPEVLVVHTNGKRFWVLLKSFINYIKNK